MHLLICFFVTELVHKMGACPGFAKKPSIPFNVQKMNYSRSIRARARTLLKFNCQTVKINPHTYQVLKIKHACRDTELQWIFIQWEQKYSHIIAMSLCQQGLSFIFQSGLRLRKTYRNFRAI